MQQRVGEHIGLVEIIQVNQGDGPEIKEKDPMLLMKKRNFTMRNLLFSKRRICFWNLPTIIEGKLLSVRRKMEIITLIIT